MNKKVSHIHKHMQTHAYTVIVFATANLADCLTTVCLIGLQLDLNQNEQNDLKK